MAIKEPSQDLEHCINFLDAHLFHDKWLMGPSTATLLESIRQHLANYQTLKQDMQEQTNESKNC